jgi:histidinol-phosphate phosphatase family protein
LDRDGVLNRLVVDPEQGTVDSPLHAAQVSLLPGVPEALARLTSAGYAMAIVSNQPAAAKGSTTLQNLQEVHDIVLQLAQQAGGRILSSHLCFHRSEDGCACRKPKTALLEEAVHRHAQGIARQRCWMVGDGIFDVEAGHAAGLKTAFLGSQKIEIAKILAEHNLHPDLWVENLPAFTDAVLQAGAR